MLTIKNKIMLRKYYKLLDKRNEAFFKGEYEKATYYGELANKYLTDVLKLEDGVPV